MADKRLPDMRKTFILPGMGADAGMYPQAHFGHLPWVTFVNWPDYRGERTLEESARRVIAENGITRHDIVGGASLGGMIAAEIARLLGIDRVILIGSTAHPKTINPFLLKASRIAGLAHVDHLQWLSRKINKSGDNLFLSMFETADGRFMRAMARAMGQWGGCGCGRARFSVRHIHGANDKVIFPPPRGAVLVPDAGHLLPITHAKQVARFITRHTG